MVRAGAGDGGGGEEEELGRLVQGGVGMGSRLAPIGLRDRVRGYALEDEEAGRVLPAMASAVASGIWDGGGAGALAGAAGAAAPAPAPASEREKDHADPNYIPVYVMLPLDVVTPEGRLNKPEALKVSLNALQLVGVDGVMCDFWWGLVERRPKEYDFDAYVELMRIVQDAGLKVQGVLSFHKCGGNVGDNVYIPLPEWVLEVGRGNPDIFYTDRAGNRNPECLSCGVDTEPVLQGRTALQCYADFMVQFNSVMAPFLGTVIREIAVGLGPAGELRYPSYPAEQGWRFPGIGEFQCYDKYMLKRLQLAADAKGVPEYGHAGPHDASHPDNLYNAVPHATGFFKNDGRWRTEYGQFFLKWYSDELLNHGDRMLRCASSVFGGQHGLAISAKVSGIHWWYKTYSHAPECTAGYFNSEGQDGYKAIALMFKRYNVRFNFTCLEMNDGEQPVTAACGPEELVRQAYDAARTAEVEFCGENALHRYDYNAYKQIASMAFTRMEGAKTSEPSISGFTFLRMTDDLFEYYNWRLFVGFLRFMHNRHTSIEPSDEGEAIRGGARSARA